MRGRRVQLLLHGPSEMLLNGVRLHQGALPGRPRALASQVTSCFLPSVLLLNFNRVLCRPPGKACCRLESTKSVAARLMYGVMFLVAMLISIIMLGNFVRAHCEPSPPPPPTKPGPAPPWLTTATWC